MHTGLVSQFRSHHLCPWSFHLVEQRTLWRATERWQQSLKPCKLPYQQHSTVGSPTRSVEEVLYQKCQQGVTKCLACRSFSSLTVWVNLSKGSEKLFQLLQQGASTFFLWEMLHVSFYRIFTWSYWKSANTLMPVASQQSFVHFSGFFFHITLPVLLQNKVTDASPCAVYMSPLKIVLSWG